ncbi:MAG: N-acyl-D-amino-acid deacylase family protein [Candidatus Zipacnadales bacterium]
MHELKLTGGKIVDGTGAPPKPSDVAINGGRITEIAADVGAAHEVIDARGLFIAPGFIDAHSHACGEGVGSILNAPEAPSAVLQGVTTVVTGMCGYSPLEIGAYYDAVAQQGTAVNCTLLIGHNSIRQEVMGNRAGPPTPEELGEMRRLVRVGMQQGALGLSTGLWYVPGAYADTDEIVELTRELSAFGGIYASHVRSENAATGEAALQEAIEIGRRTGVAVQVAHLKAAERPAWGQGRQRLAILEGGRSQGVDIHADAYPYTASSTSLNVCLPPEAFEGEGLAAKLRNPQQAQAYRTHIAQRLERIGGPQRVLVVSAARPGLAGKRLHEAAQDMGLHPVEAILELVRLGPNSAIYFVMDQADVDEIITHPLVMIGSDAGVRRPGEGHCHPRTWGTFPRVLRRYVRELGRLQWSEAIRKMTAQTARKFRLRDRGVVRKGAWADLVLWDPESVADRATFEDPHQPPVGIHMVLVNGQRVAVNGELTGARPGMVIRGFSQ